MPRLEATFAAILALAGCGTGASSAHAVDGGGSSPADAGDAAMLPYGGRVVLEESDQGKEVFFATARFTRSADRVLFEGCSDVPLASGACCFVPADAWGHDPGVSAGSIDIDRNGSPLGELTFGREGYASLQDPPAADLWWMAGDTLHVTATGSLVEAFSGSVVAPPLPEILSVPEPHGSVLSLSIAEASSKPTFYTWAPAGPAGAQVLLVLRDVATGSVKCLADDEAGILSIPPQLVVSSFQAHDSGYLYIGRLLAGQAPENADVEIASFAVVEWGFLFTE
jgi:hypothetical protein